MKGLPAELVYILLFAVILLVQFLMRRAGTGQKGEPKEGAPRSLDERLAEMLGVMREPEPEPPPAPAADPFPVVAYADEARPMVPEVRRRRRSAARALLTGRRNLRRAVVALTVLGPCRAMDPPEGASAGALPGREAR